MGAPLNNRNAVGHGRPPDLARQLTVADQAAHRVAKLVGRPGSISRCAADLAERWSQGEPVAFIRTEGLDGLEGTALVAEITKRLAAKSRAMLLLVGHHLDAAGRAALAADIEEGGAVLACTTGGQEGPATKNFGDDWSEWCATAGALLDRLVPDEGTRQ